MECVEIATGKAHKVIVGSLLPRYDNLNLHLKTQLVNALLLEKGQVNSADPTDFAVAPDVQKKSSKYKICGIHFDIR